MSWHIAVEAMWLVPQLRVGRQPSRVLDAGPGGAEIASAAQVRSEKDAPPWVAVRRQLCRERPGGPRTRPLLCIVRGSRVPGLCDQHGAVKRSAMAYKQAEEGSFPWQVI